MVKAYLNYPNSRVSAHTDISCGEIRKMRKPGQRTIRFDPTTFSCEIARFIHKEHPFASQQEYNDMWLEIDFGDTGFELAVLRYVHGLLGDRYKPFADARFEIHC